MRFEPLFLVLFINLYLTLTFAIPVRPSPRSHARLKSRQLEEELIAGVEDRVELFDTPRIHDSSEQIHDEVEKNNVTSPSLLEAIQTRRQQQAQQQVKFRPIILTQQSYSYNHPNKYVGNSQYFGPLASGQRAEVGGYNQGNSLAAGYRKEPYGKK
ncbi:uncharacterized protein MEPE_04115 [Melanopsichium pennsylvanicum]|uniref:Uncharacterized protein n=2 Tax=Melanopsichium pennsylvanicum TaxID=63383 RepID=A0AAJ4XP95_9BASI|nr:hypothetical protein BN887_06299 [Melanopsichium pennsylvanicum 4]SNX85406.1 uncharacterized protein MEPE_04115 [Melanopsichium pennsylvanicum]